jgi:hypothetical protein
MTRAMDIISSSLAMDVSSNTNDPTSEVSVTPRREEGPLESSTTTTTATAPMSSALSEATPMCDPWADLIREKRLGPASNEQVATILPPTPTTSMPSSVLSAPAPWPEAEPIQQIDASVSVIPPVQIQLDAREQLDIGAGNQSMADADEETKAHLRDEDAPAVPGVANEGLRRIRDEKRAREIDRVERMIDPAYGIETPGVILQARRDAEMPQGDKQSSLALVRRNEELARAAASYVFFLDANKDVLILMAKD